MCSLQYININKEITGLSCGVLSREEAKDVLLVGGQASLQAYDVSENTDLFYMEVPDGVNSIICGFIKEVDMPLVIVGGNCSITGFDAEGEEKFWTVSGDVARSMAFVDYDLDDNMELVVGSDDYYIRIYKHEELIFDINESARVNFLSRVRNSNFTYALDNGNVGIYSKKSRIWQIKHKYKACALMGLDFNCDGHCESIIGYENGKLEVRSDLNGSIIYKSMLPHALAQLIYADYRLDSKGQVICCTVEGGVLGFTPNSVSRAHEFEPSDKLIKGERTKISDLNKRKQTLLNQIATLSGDAGKDKVGKPNVMSFIPKDTSIVHSFYLDNEKVIYIIHIYI